MFFMHDAAFANTSYGAVIPLNSTLPFECPSIEEDFEELTQTEMFSYLKELA